MWRVEVCEPPFRLISDRLATGPRLGLSCPSPSPRGTTRFAEWLGPRGHDVPDRFSHENTPPLCPKRRRLVLRRRSLLGAGNALWGRRATPRPHPGRLVTRQRSAVSLPHRVCLPRPPDCRPGSPEGPWLSLLMTTRPRERWFGPAELEAPRRRSPTYRTSRTRRSLSGWGG